MPFQKTGLAVLVAGAAFVAATLIPTGPADAQGSPAVRKKCGAWASKQVPNAFTTDDRRRKGALFQQCVAKGGKV